MYSKNRLIQSMAVAVFMSFAAQAQAAFDKGGVLGVGARAMGMGGAFVGIADDATAIQWNPAGLVQLPRMELSAYFAPLLNGKEYYTSGAFVMPFLEQTALGFSIVSLYHDTGNDTTRASENTYYLSIATPLNVEKTVSFGVNMKFLQYDSQASARLSSGQVIEAKAGALGMDLGVLYQIPLPAFGKKVSLGFLAQDLDTVLRWQSGVEERVPLLIDFGGAYWIEENLAIDVEYSFFNDSNISGKPLGTTLTDTATGRTITSLEPQQHRPHVGIEGWFFNDHLGLRTGYTGFATTADRFTAGVSYKESSFSVDYAYMGHAEHLGDSHRLSGNVKFGEGGERPRVVALVNPPANLGARPANNQVTLIWDASQDPHVTGYTIYMSRSPGGSFVPVQKRLKENRVIVDGLTNGTRYYFVVTCLNNSWPAVESAYSQEVSAVPAPIIQGAPVMGGQVSNDAPANNFVSDVSGWAIPTGNLVGYNLYMSETSGSGYKKVNEGPITKQNFVVKGLEPNKRYYFYITSLTIDNPPTESRPSSEFSKISVPDAELPVQAPAPGAAPASVAP